MVDAGPNSSQPKFHQELPATWQRLVAFWWVCVWRALLGSMATGFVTGFILGFVAAAFGLDKTVVTIGNLILGLIFGGLWTFLALRMAFRKRYRGFRIAIISDELPQGTIAP